MKHKIIFLTAMLWANFANAQVIQEDYKALPDTVFSNAGDNYGNSVAIDGDFAVAGAPLYNKNSGCVYLLHKNDSSWETIAVFTPNDSSYDALFGYSVDISGNVIVVGANGDNETTGAAYVFEFPLNNWTNVTQLAKLTALNNNPGDNFGYSVSIDNETIVVGAYQSNNAVGSAYVYEKPISGWTDMTQTATLSAGPGSSPNAFGFSVGISDSVVAVTALSDYGIGAVFVFEKPAGGWTDMPHTARLTSTNINFTYFGWSLAISDDLIAVGSFFDNVHLYEKPATGWADMTQTAKLQSSSYFAQMLGYSLDIYDDFVVAGSNGGAFVFEKPASGWTDMTETAELVASNSQGVGCSISIYENSVLVGANSDNESGLQAGAVLAYDKPDYGWANITENQKILPAQPYPNNSLETFGSSVASDGEYTVVGAPYHYLNGAAYVLRYTGNSWENVAVLSASDGALNDEFGSFVAIDDETIVVGAPNNDFDSKYDCGAVYIFEKPDSGWTDMTQTAKLTASDGGSNNYLGKSVSISGDVVAVGAHMNNDVGAIYVFEKPSAGWSDMTQTAKLTSSNGVFYGSLGVSVSISNNTIVGGAYTDDGNMPSSGAVYVFEKPAAGWTDMTQTAKLIASDGESGDYFGIVDIYSDLIVVGAYADDMMGSAYIFEKPVNGWSDTTQTVKITSSDRSMDDVFGSSVAIYGDMIVIGAQNKDNLGASYLYKKPSNGWADTTQTIKLLASDGESNNNFGVSVSIYDDIIVVGANYSDENGSNSGSVYFYHPDCSLFDNEPPAITCIEDKTINLPRCKSEYYVCGDALDLLSIADNCQIDSIINDYNASSTLSGASFPLGTTTVTWIVTDVAGNESQCSFDIDVQKISLFPNPAQDYINVSFNNPSDRKISIHNLNGKMLLIQDCDDVEQEMNISKLKKGIYILKIQRGKNIYKTKFIKAD